MQIKLKKLVFEDTACNNWHFIIDGWYGEIWSENSDDGENKIT
jgi:hypothetical protein